MAQSLLAAADAWKMTFQSVHYLLLLPLVVGVYFLLPRTCVRRVWLLVASYYFYFFAAPKYLVVLMAGTLFAFVAGLLIHRAKSPGAKRGWQAAGVGGLVLGLAFFKYNDFFAALLAPIFTRAGISYEGDYFVAAAAMGISFYTFMAIGYLIDVGRGDVPAEKNLLSFALFLGFFPAVLSGPISRAGALLPQLKDDGRRFDAAGARDAVRLMAVGFFKKLAVADMLAVFVNAVYADYAAYLGLSRMLAAALFVLQLYFDFSGYTDIALGSARLLGITLPQNFQNPYFATNFSGFWARWHMSLSGWLQDYIFTPIVWGGWSERLRLRKKPVLFAIAVVFLVSGAWHGDTLNYLVWGALMAAYRIGEELLHRRLGKPKKRPPLARRIGKTAVVLVLWCFSLIFFAMGMQEGATLVDSLRFLSGLFAGLSPAALWQDIQNAFLAGLYNNLYFVWLALAFTAVCTALAVWADWYQCFHLKGGSLVLGMQRLRPLPRWLLYYFLVLACYAAFVASGGGGFLYGGF